MPVFAQFDITGKIAVVTGTSRGLGKGYAEGLAQAGARVPFVKPVLDHRLGHLHQCRALGKHTPEVVAGGICL